MPPESHKDIARRALQMWDSDNSDEPNEIFTEDYVNHQEPDLDGGLADYNLAEWKEMLATDAGGWSDVKVRVLRQVAEDELVASHFESTATHTGEVMGIAPTGNDLSWTGVSIDRFEEGKIAETWIVWDKYRLFEELGGRKLALIRHPESERRWSGRLSCRRSAGFLRRELYSATMMGVSRGRLEHDPR
ncbi:MAG: ester cyclase, partial [Rubrobacteraceae bacterium]